MIQLDLYFNASQIIIFKSSDPETKSLLKRNKKFKKISSYRKDKQARINYLAKRFVNFEASQNFEISMNNELLKGILKKIFRLKLLRK